MIIKNLLNKIQINYLTYLMYFIGLLSGLFKDLFAIFLLILFHETGHFLSAIHYKWNIKKIIIYPFGGLTKYEDIIDKPLKEELMISISGIIFQCLYYLIIYLLNKHYLIDARFFYLTKKYNFSIIIFNLIPIIPLDGSKIYNVLLNKVFNFRLSYYITLITSLFLFIIFIIYFKFDKSNIIISSFMIFELIDSYKKRKYYFKRFILEKYLYNNPYKKYKYIKNIKNMNRNKKHLIKDNNIYLSEKKYIKKRSI